MERERDRHDEVVEGRTEVERTILDVLRERGPGDFETLWLGFLPNYEPVAVQHALQRLKRRGVIECDRRWWQLVGDPDGQARPPEAGE